jgi:hypothetical protein
MPIAVLLADKDMSTTVSNQTAVTADPLSKTDATLIPDEATQSGNSAVTGAMPVQTSPDTDETTAVDVDVFESSASLDPVEVEAITEMSVPCADATATSTTTNATTIDADESAAPTAFIPSEQVESNNIAEVDSKVRV